MTEHKREQERSIGRRTTRATASASPESHLMCVLRAVRNVNQLITREKDHSTLLRRACEILTETRGFRSAWIGLGDAGGLMKVDAESEIGEGFAAARAEWERTGWPACARQALAGGGVAVLHDPKTNCSQCPLSRTYRDSAALAAPMQHEGRVYGVLVVALPRAAADDAEERSLLAEIAGDLAFALNAIEVEDRHRAAEAREAHLKQVLLAIRNVNQLIVQEGDPRRLIDRACHNLTETMGYDNAWIALLGGEAARDLGLPETGPVAAVAAAGSRDACDRLVERLMRGEFTACMRRALAAANLVVEGDPAANCPDCPLHKAYGARAGFARRLDFEGVTYGILAVSVPAAYARNDAEHDLFNEVAGDLAFALLKIAAARRLEQVRRRYREIFEKSRDGFVMVDSAGRVLDANEAYCAMLGYTLDELRALPDFYAITPERWHAWEKDEIWQNRLLGHGCSGLYEKEYIRKDGVVFPVELRSYVVRREDGQVDYLWGTARDITERKQAEGALKRQNAMLARAEALAHVGSWEWDIAADRVRWSDELFRIFRRDPDRGAPSFTQHPDFYLPEDMQRLREAVERCTSQGTPYEIDLRAIRSDGEIRHCVARGQAETDEAGRIVQLAGSVQDLTEQKKLVRELENQRRRLESLMNAIPAPVFFKDKDGRYLGCNPAFEALTGCTSAQIAGKPLHEVWPEKYGATYRDKDLELLESGGLQQYEFKLTNAQGVERTVVFYKATFGGPSGEIDGLVGVILDITERKEAEEALKQSERVMRYIIKHDPNALAVYDTELRYIAVSDRYLKDYGVAEADILGRHHYEVFPEMPQRWKDVHRRVLAGATERNDDDSFERPDGTITYNRWECRPWYLADGSIGGMITYTEVTTERKLAERALIAANTKLNLAMEAAGQGLWEWDLITDAVRFDDPALSMLGFCREDIRGPMETGTWWMGRVHPDDRAFMEERFSRYVSGEEEGYIVEFRLADKVGGYRWVSSSAKLISKDSAGKPWIVVGIHQDITDRKHAEREREKLIAQLQQAQKMEAVGRLAGGVAHDFNNMLGVILGHTEFAMEKVASTEPLHADLEEIQKAARRSADITRQLLAFARKQTVAPKVLDINETIESMLKMLERLIGEDIDLRWEPGHGLWPVKMDPAQIDQILANLCVNARDAIADVGKVTIETNNIVFEEEYCKEHDGFFPGEYTMMAVSDDGCGMDAEMLTHLFEPFFTTKEMGKGTGLGLATVYGIVKQNNGFINVYSEPSQGMTFKIYLPRHAAKVAETKELKPQAAKRGGETILLVEDEPAILEITTRMLERLGYTVIAHDKRRDFAIFSQIGCQ